MKYEAMKELLKPPFVYGGNYKWDWDTYHIRAEVDGRETALLKVMPIADHGYYKNLLGEYGWQRFIKDLTAFATSALNEKAAREWGERKRWINPQAISRLWHICPICDWEYESHDNYNYCPSCGERLYPPEVSDA